MNLQQPLNIWRVYLDLFANLIGAVAIGGAGVMAMVGGAMINSSQGASSFPMDCRNGKELAQTQIMTDVSGRRSVIHTPGTCQVELVYPGLSSVKSETAGAQWDSESLKQACGDLKILSNFRSERGLDDKMSIDVVGRASRDYTNTAKCETSFSADQGKIKGILVKLQDPGDRNAIKTVLDRNRRAEPTAGALDRQICNEPFAMARARRLVDACARDLWNDAPGAAEGLGLDRIQRVPSLVPNEAVTTACVEAMRRKGRGGGEGEDDVLRSNCERVVSLRVSLPPQTRGLLSHAEVQPGG